MNLITAQVISIDSKPEFKYEKWWVKATVTAYGRESKTDAMFNSKQEAESFKVGSEIDI